MTEIDLNAIKAERARLAAYGAQHVEAAHIR